MLCLTVALRIRVRQSSLHGGVGRNLLRQLSLRILGLSGSEKAEV
jgi:hypothetical protein